MKIVNPEAFNSMLVVKFSVVHGLDSRTCFSHIKYSDYSIFAISYAQILVYICILFKQTFMHKTLLIRWQVSRSFLYYKIYSIM